jgi:hypothetical protein
MATPSLPEPATEERQQVMAEGIGVDQHGNPEPGTARQLRTRQATEGVEVAGDEPNRTQPGELTPPDEDGTEAEPWLTRTQRRTIQRAVSQALDRQAGTVRRRRHQRPAHYTGQREPVRVARARAQGRNPDGP